MVHNDTQKIEKIVSMIIFIIYIFIVLKLTIFRLGVHYDVQQLNLILFINLIKVYKNIGLMEFLRLFLGNIGWFLPFGFILPMLIKKNRLFKIAALGFMFSFGIEALQFIFRKGVAELDDLILNTIGTIIGYFLYRLLMRVRKIPE